MSLTIPVKELFVKENETSRRKHWSVVELGDAVQIQNGYPFESKYFNRDEGFPLIRIRDVMVHKSETYYSGEYDPAFIIRKGDLLVGMDGDFNCALWKGEDGLLNQRVCRLIVNEKILLKKFLFYGLGGYLKVISSRVRTLAQAIENLKLNLC